MAYSGTVASRASIPEVLKPIFDDQAREVLPNEYAFWKYIKEADGERIKLDGEKFVIELQTKRNDRSQSFSELGDLPSSGVPEFKKAELTPVRIAQPIQIGHEMMLLADRDQATFTTRLEQLWNDAKEALVLNLNRQSVWDGTGKLATVGGTLTGGSATGTLTVDDTTYLEENGIYDIYQTGTSTLRNTAPVRFVVSAILTATTCTVSMSDGSTVPNGVVSTDVVVRAGAGYNGTSAVNEMNGLQAITADADFMGLAKTNRRWNAVRVNASAAAIGPRLLAKAQIQMRRASRSGGKITTIFCSPEQSLEVVYGPSGSVHDARFTRDDASKASIKNAHKPTLNFDGREIQINTELMLPVTKAWMFNEEALLVGQLHDVKMEEFGNGMTSLPVFNPTTGSYVAADISWLVWRGNMGAFARNEFCEVYGLATPA